MIEPNLELIAARLEGLEETIIARLIDRAQFAANEAVYLPGQSGFSGAHGESLFALRLRAQEEMDAAFGRFSVPEERPFHRDLPAPRRQATPPQNCLHIDDYDFVNLSATILDRYHALVPLLCAPGDDGQYGSSVEMDVYAFHAIARRIHFGGFYVAESKYFANPETYAALAAAHDTDGMITLLTRKEVEDRILDRVRKKVESMQATANTAVRRAIDPEIVVAFYRDTVIPLTKEGEIAYLYKRKKTV